MTADAFASFLALPEQERRDVFAAAARRLDTVSGHVEKDFRVCLVLDALFNRFPPGHPQLLFKGGTSLSRVFRLIRRILEDIDLGVHRDGLGFAGERDPTIATGHWNRRRGVLFDELTRAWRRQSAGWRGDTPLRPTRTTPADRHSWWRIPPSIPAATPPMCRRA